MENDELFPAEELSKIYDIEISFINSLDERGLIEIVKIEEKNFLNRTGLSNLEKMIRLHFDLDINLEGIEAITHLLQRIELLQNNLVAAKNRLRMLDSE